jgi:hypothetical protein
MLVELVLHIMPTVLVVLVAVAVVLVVLEPQLLLDLVYKLLNQEVVMIISLALFQLP